MHVTNESLGTTTGAGGAHADPRRALAVDGGQEGAGGRIGAAPVALGGPARGREPDPILGPRDGRRLRGLAPPRARVAVGGPRRAGRRGGGAHRRRGVPHPREPGGATPPRGPRSLPGVG